MKKCKHCNLTFEDSKKFCIKCGEPLVLLEGIFLPTQDFPVSETKQVSNKALSFKISIAISLLIVLVITILIFSSKGDSDKFCGTWQYNDYGSKYYFKITDDKNERFKFQTGYLYEGNINWTEVEIKNADDIYLTYSDGKLNGEFISSNFYATHGEEFTYKVTIVYKSNNKLLYSVWSSIRGETETKEAVRTIN
jgi:hypothetical protein